MLGSNMSSKDKMENYYLWSDVRILDVNDKVTVPVIGNDGMNYDGIIGKWVDEPLLYCFIVDLEIVEICEENVVCKVLKIKEIGY